MIFLPPRLFYVVLSLPFLALWLFLFLWSRKTRREQGTMSVSFALVGVLMDNFFYYRDYWLPSSIFGLTIGGIKIYLEQVLFAFAAFGIAAVLYQFFLGQEKELMATHKRPSRKEVLGVVLIFGFLAYLLMRMDMNSIFSTSLASLALSAYIIIRRHDLLFMSLMGGLLFMLVTFLLYSFVYASAENIEDILKQIWLLYDTPYGIRVLNIPLVELAWAFSVGISVSVFYKYVTGSTL